MKRQIYSEKSRESCLNFTAGAVDSLRIKNTSATTVRVYEDGYIGVAGAAGNCDIGELEKKAVSSLENKVPYPCDKSEPARRVCDCRKEIIKKSEVVEKCAKLVKRISEENPAFVFSGKFAISDDEERFSDSDGVDYECVSSVVSAYFIGKHRDSANIMDEIYEISDDKFEPEKIAADAKKLFGAYLKKAEIPDGDKIVVIADISVLSSLVRSFVAEMYFSGASILNGKLGQKVFNEKFSLYCDKDSSKGMGKIFFDGEGVVSKDDKVYFVENGVMKNLLTTKKSAATFGVGNCGTAQSPYAETPAVGTRGLTVAAGDESVGELVRGEKAVYVSIASGGDMTPSGEIGIPVQSAYLYENGTLVGRVPEFTVSCNIFDMLGDDFIGASTKCVNEAGQRKYLVFRAKALKA